MKNVFEFIYNDCIYEGSAITISIHKTRKGAEIAMMFHKEKEREEWERLYTNEEDKEDFPFDCMSFWGIRKTELEE